MGKVGKWVGAGGYYTSKQDKGNEGEDFQGARSQEPGVKRWSESQFGQSQREMLAALNFPIFLTFPISSISLISQPITQRHPICYTQIFCAGLGVEAKTF